MQSAFHLQIYTMFDAKVCLRCPVRSAWSFLNILLAKFGVYTLKVQKDHYIFYLLHCE